MTDDKTGIIQQDGLRFGPLGERWAHLCVDMQRMFAEPTGWQTAWLPRVLPQVIEIVELAPERTFFSRFVPPASPEDVTGTWRRYYERYAEMTLGRLDPSMVELVPELARFTPPAQLVDKRAYSPWFGTTLEAELQRHGVDTLIVTGAETEVCVLAAVLGAIDRGYRVIIASDAICSSADETHDAMQAIYHSRYGMQVETATAAEIVGAKVREGVEGWFVDK